MMLFVKFSVYKQMAIIGVSSQLVIIGTLTLMFWLIFEFKTINVNDVQDLGKIHIISN